VTLKSRRNEIKIINNDQASGSDFEEANSRSSLSRRLSGKLKVRTDMLELQFGANPNNQKGIGAI
jgi:hypothetical protein